MKKYLLALLVVVIIIAMILQTCNTNEGNVDPGDEPVAAAPPAIPYNLTNVYPHDTSFYVQGLQWYNGALYEGTGFEGKSRLMKIDLATGKPLQSQPLPATHFGEGVTILNDTVYQLTWQNNKVHVYDVKTFKKLREFSWPYEGWGITHDGTHLYISTGGSNIYVVSPSDFKILNTISVKDNYGPVNNLNELEWVNGHIYANVYGRYYIVKIDPATGTVQGRIDLADIWQKSGRNYDASHIDVLNGIAYDSTKNNFLVTGKWWPYIFEIKLNQ